MRNRTNKIKLLHWGQMQESSFTVRFFKCTFQKFLFTHKCAPINTTLQLFGNYCSFLPFVTISGSQPKKRINRTAVVITKRFTYKWGLVLRTIPEDFTFVQFFSFVPSSSFLFYFFSAVLLYRQKRVTLKIMLQFWVENFLFLVLLFVSVFLCRFIAKQNIYV